MSPPAFTQTCRKCRQLRQLGWSRFHIQPPDKGLEVFGFEFPRADQIVGHGLFDGALEGFGLCLGLGFGVRIVGWIGSHELRPHRPKLDSQNLGAVEARAEALAAVEQRISSARLKMSRLLGHSLDVVPC